MRQEPIIVLAFITCPMVTWSLLSLNKISVIDLHFTKLILSMFQWFSKGSVTSASLRPFQQSRCTIPCWVSQDPTTQLIQSVSLITLNEETPGGVHRTCTPGFKVLGWERNPVYLMTRLCPEKVIMRHTVQKNRKGIKPPYQHMKRDLGGNVCFKVLDNV